MMSDTRRGVVLGATAYALWGLSALYWPLLEPSGAVEILALRIVWSPVAILCLLVLLQRWDRVRELLRRPREAALLALAGVLTSINWGLFIWATTHDRVVDASLGYFITPLVTVGLGVVVLRERLRPAQTVAVALGLLAVVVLTVDYGRPPWVALGLASTFGVYSLIKKHVNAGAVEGLMIETVVLFPLALVFTIFLQVSGRATFGHVSAANTALAIGSGFVMMAPLLLFSAAATRVRLSVVGMLQYIEPVVQFLIGLLVFHERMPASRWIGFAIVWGALVILPIDALRGRGRQQRGKEEQGMGAGQDVPTAP